LWRQGRFEQRPRHRQDNRPRGGQRDQRAAASGAAGAPAARQGEANRTREGGEGGRDNGRPRFDRKSGGKPQGEGGRPDNRNRGERPGGDKRDGDRSGFKGKPAFQQKPREERPVRVDPDSPFAKLAALRDQLKK
jgi:ATP-dependent RNA helicase SUPV3L1/SUV3